MPTDARTNTSPRKKGLKALLPIRVDLYIITEVLGPFLGGVVFFSFIFLMFQTLRLAEAFIEHAVPLGILIKMIGLMIVSFLPMALPLAFLIGLLVAFGRLSSDSELVALKANGLSIHRLALPAVIVGLFVAALSLGLNLEWVPEAKTELKVTLLRLTNTKPIATIREGTFTSGFFDLLLYAEKVDQNTNEMQNVFIYDERDPKNPLAIIAHSGEIVPVKVESDLGASIALRLYDGDIHSNDIRQGTYQKMSFREYQVYLRIDPGANTIVGKATMHPYHILKRALTDEKDAAKLREVKTEIYKRWFTAFAPLIFVMIGIGFGTVRGRAVRSGAAITTLSIIVPYFLIQTFCENLAYSGKLLPLIATLIPNVLLLLVGVIGYRKATW
ncbi:MAG: LptF/LptG family permease [Cryobacterium sp.]|nr:LptF/LptG family permease [Oligoflexia bacterium]